CRGGEEKRSQELTHRSRLVLGSHGDAIQVDSTLTSQRLDPRGKFFLAHLDAVRPGTKNLEQRNLRRLKMTAVQVISGMEDDPLYPRGWRTDDCDLRPWWNLGGKTEGMARRHAGITDTPVTGHLKSNSHGIWTGISESRRPALPVQSLVSPLDQPLPSKA